MKMTSMINNEIIPIKKGTLYTMYDKYQTKLAYYNK